jgi:hypothetical protein
MSVKYEKMIERLQKGETILNYKEGGTSMIPLLHPYQPVDIRPVDKEIEVGDIVFAKVRGKYYTSHLVTAVASKRIQISNNHGHVNGWTAKKNVYGIATAS